MGIATIVPPVPVPLATSAPRPLSIGVVSTYPPTWCGLASFTSALVEHLRSPSCQVGVVRVVETAADVLGLGTEVVSHLVNDASASAAAAAARLNQFDVVLLQHEYGIFGGPDGADVLPLVHAVTAPLVVVLHTVLERPTPSQRRILLDLLHSADVVVTMTETARQRLIGIYGADPAQLLVVPHGAVDSRHGADGAPVRARPTVLTWGLLGPGKGIEWAVDALAGLRDLDPRYLVLGRTHPKVAEAQGEAYRELLVDRARRNGVDDLLELDPRYLDRTALGRVVAAADVVLLPYDSVDQVTSGVLIEAVAAGRPVVSTAFPHAVELLGNGTGLLVPQRDAAAIGHAVRRVLTEPGLAQQLSSSAAARAPELLWPAVAARYRGIARTVWADARLGAA